MMRISGAHTSFLSFRLFSLAAASTAGRICSMIQSLRSTQRWIEAIVSRKNRPKQGKVWAAKDRMRRASAKTEIPSNVFTRSAFSRKRGRDMLVDDQPLAAASHPNCAMAADHLAGLVGL